jgi:hypothetical protein
MDKVNYYVAGTDSLYVTINNYIIMLFLIL